MTKKRIIAVLSIVILLGLASYLTFMVISNHKTKSVITSDHTCQVLFKGAVPVSLDKAKSRKLYSLIQSLPKSNNPGKILDADQIVSVKENGNVQATAIQADFTAEFTGCNADGTCNGQTLTFAMKGDIGIVKGADSQYVVVPDRSAKEMFEFVKAL